LSIDIKITEEEKCISILFSLSDSWDNLAMAIEIKNTTMKLDDVVTALLSEDMAK
jgi:hypothetical protein